MYESSGKGIARFDQLLFRKVAANDSGSVDVAVSPYEHSLESNTRTVIMKW